MRRMTWIWGTLTACTFALAIANPATAQEKKDEKPKTEAKKPDAKPQDKKPTEAAGQGQPAMTPEQQKEMEAWMKHSAVTENHKLLQYSVGEWTYENKMWMAPDAPPMTTNGTCSTKSIMDGRFVVSEHKGDFMGQPFHGISTTGYDNFKKKYVGTWIDSMGTGIMNSEGVYDPGTKTFTFMAEMDDIVNGGKIKVREVIKVVDADKHSFEWYETRGGKEQKTMEITYSRKK